MGIEIERKYLVRGDSWRQHASEGIRYRQGYLAGIEKCSVRLRIAGGSGFLNIKGATLGVQRSEYEYAIPLKDAEEILERFCDRPLIEKTRYLVPHGRHTWEVDVFEGDNAGLVVAEVELKSSNEAPELPEWVGVEVSDDPRYYNVCLTKHPYKEWGPDPVPGKEG